MTTAQTGWRHGTWRGLLVSVRNAAEARAALAGGAAIIDVKEPSRGPLGGVDPDVAAAVAVVAAGAVPWTIACGELRSGLAAALVTTVVAAGATPPAAAKAGPAGLAAGEWRQAFAAFARGLPSGVEPIAVAYADWRRTAAPEPPAVIEAAAAAGCRTLLFDTGDKSGPGLMSPELAADAARWIAAARRAGFAVAAGGRLTLDDIPDVIGLGGQVVAFRGAVCRGGRTGPVDPELVRAAATLVATAEPIGGPDSVSPSGVRM